MTSGYFHTVNQKTPTRFWVNNPTPAEARAAIKAGASGCTTNPTYASKMLIHPEMMEIASATVQSAVENHTNDSDAASEVQSRLVQYLLGEFEPIHAASKGTKGWVSIQGDPEKEERVEAILEEAESNRRLGPNYIAKVPVTRSGLKAIEALSHDGVPVIATEVMSISQAVAAAETYLAAIVGNKKPAPIYITHITGIFDQCLSTWNERNAGGLSDDALRFAGSFVAKKQCRIFDEQKYPVTILGGGARGLHHFTDFVGSSMHITINWKGTADQLIQENLPVTPDFSTDIDSAILDELMNKAPIFRQAWEDEGLSIDHYHDFPPVELFRSMFLKGWTDLKTKISEVRNAQ